MREEMKKEAISRMKILKLHPNVIKEFSGDGILNLSLNSILYHLSDEQSARVQEFERQYHALVYHVIHDYTNFGECLVLFFVTKFPEEWKLDCNDLKEGYPIVYVANLTDETCSGFGNIGIESCNGSVIRAY